MIKIEIVECRRLDSTLDKVTDVCYALVQPKKGK
jgi:hypothetical protein